MKSPDKDVKQSLVYVNQELREIQDADYNRATPSCKWYLGLSWCLSGKESTCLSGDLDSIPELGRSLGEGNDNPVQYSCLGNPMDGGVVGYRRWGHEKARQDLAPKQQPQWNGIYRHWIIYAHKGYRYRKTGEEVKGLSLITLQMFKDWNWGEVRETKGIPWQWWDLSALTAWGPGSIPGEGTRILQVSRCGQERERGWGVGGKRPRRSRQKIKSEEAPEAKWRQWFKKRKGSATSSKGQVKWGMRTAHWVRS